MDDARMHMKASNVTNDDISPREKIKSDAIAPSQMMTLHHELTTLNAAENSQNDASHQDSCTNPVNLHPANALQLHLHSPNAVDKYSEKGVFDAATGTL